MSGIFTKKDEMAPFDAYNTYNIRDGKVDHCDVSGGDHEWNTRNTGILTTKEEPCYNCKSEVNNKHGYTTKYYKCTTCYRPLCTDCNHSLDQYATKNFTKQMAESVFGRR
jgi:hypothetical protein